MLGGYGILANDELQKTFKDINIEHSNIRISGSFHFIDAWSGETGYIKVLDTEKDIFSYVWTQNYDIAKSKNGINVCGSDYVEGQLTVEFDITLPHSSNSISLAFGSTLQGDPFENSFGISNLKIWTR